MTKLEGDILIIMEEPETKCAFCNTIAECRPYGPNQQMICFKCGMKPKYKEIVTDNFKALLD